MTQKKEKKFIYRILNFKVLFRYLLEVFDVIRQGYTFRDKFILCRHYLKIPVFILQSLIQKKLLIEIEKRHKVLSGDVTMRNEHGIFFCGRNLLTVLPVVNSYEKHFDPYFSIDEGVFIDVGAHIGKYSIRLANRLKGRGTVIALEPEKSNFELLQTNVRLNQLDNMICLNMGAYSEATELTFYVMPTPGEMYNSLYKKSEDSKVEKIAVDTIDNMVNSLNINRVDLIKIDTEGAEQAVVEGALATISQHKPGIILEVWSVESLNRITEILKTCGYGQPLSIDGENYYFAPV